MNEIVIGDIIQMDTGDKIPCDGVLLKCDMLEVDESDLTGESDEIVKSLKNDPFVLSGCRVTAGTGVFVAIAVGETSQWGVIQAHFEEDQDQTPLQEKLDVMAEQIGHVGTASAVATFIAMMVIKIFIKPAHLDDVSVFHHA